MDRRAAASRSRILAWTCAAAVGAGLSAAPAATAAPGDISTFAGTGVGGFSGDGGPATSAELNGPGGLAVDGAGSLYIADTSNNRVRKVSSSGTITTVAGTGTRGSSGDGGPATEADFVDPSGVALDGSGDLYIAETGTGHIRKVDGSGTVTTVAVANFLDHPFGMSSDGSGNIYIADPTAQLVRKLDASNTLTTVAGTPGNCSFSGDGGPATAAALCGPFGVAADDSGTVYIADSNNNRVRMVDGSGTITTVAGNGDLGFSGDGGPATSAELGYLRGVAVDASGNLYIADSSNNRVRMVDGSGTITTVAGTGTEGFSGDGGPATSAELDGPVGVALDGSGNLYISDESHRVRKVEGPDTVPPTTTISGPSGTTNDPTPTFGFSSEPGSTFECKLDSGPYATCSPPKTTAHLADGSHTLKVRATDPADNLGPEASRTFTVDTAEVSISGSSLVVSAAIGAKDNLTITRPSPSTLRVTDLASGPYTGSGVHTTTAGCTRSGDYTVNCNNTAGITLIRVLAADQADQVTNSTSLQSALNGGPANDALIGGFVKDTLTGAAGADVMKGMNGNDLLQARDLASDQTINCDGGGAPGAADKADLDLLPLDPNSKVTGCETKTRN